MARKAIAPQSPSPYECLARRIQKQLLTPRVQLERRTVIQRQDSEPEDAWLQLLDELAQQDPVTIVRQQDGSVELTWTHPGSDW